MGSMTRSAMRTKMGAGISTAIFLICYIAGRTEGRRDRDNLNIVLDVPSWAKVGGTVTMQCKYDVGGEPVYQVKWYKGIKEFYRYVPKEIPPVKTFLFPGLHLDLSRSNATAITLKKLDLSARGTYTCEVSTDYPDFITGVKSSQLDVVAFPESNPVISKLKSHYSVGDILEANCTSYRSKPSANLTWYINSEKVNPDYLVPPQGYRTRESKNDSLENAHLNLRFELRPEHFQHGRVTLQCTARIHDYYHKSSEVTIFEADKPKLSSVVDNSSSSSSSGSGSSSGVSNSGSKVAGDGKAFGYYVYSTGINIFLFASSSLLLPQHLVAHRFHEN